ncbi:phosphotransferases/inositol or phosphatidylinositol kinase [Anaeramoeba ignava]|uniref:Phosphotransferases/inositol or phosphatidylinositol kinase n=1 Tax=Anaeramoeba ignava TaxID=1746090 RepID=A0A9Q0RDF6_ANAIG|nr:phosphotransferases/inositol or phosphatidylinositol kinase [Anaeramoeba ignava]
MEIKMKIKIKIKNENQNINNQNINNQNINNQNQNNQNNQNLNQNLNQNENNQNNQNQNNINIKNPKLSTQIGVTFYRELGLIFSMIDIKFHKKFFALNLESLLDSFIKYTEPETVMKSFFVDKDSFAELSNLVFNYISQHHNDKSNFENPKVLFAYKFFEFFLSSIESFEENVQQKLFQSNFTRIIPKIIRRSFTLTQKTKFSMHFLKFLTMIFSTLKKYKKLHNYLLNFIPSILEICSYFSPHSQEMHLECIRLLLSIPLQIPMIIPYLLPFFEQLAHGLNSNSEEIAEMSLKIVDYFIENIQLKFLFDKIGLIEEQFAQALIRHLDSVSPKLSARALSIVSKIGSWNRRFLYSKVHRFESKKPFKYERSGLEFALHFPDISNNTSQNLCIKFDECIEISIEILENGIDDETKLSAFQLLKNCLFGLIGKISLSAKDSNSNSPNSQLGTEQYYNTQDPNTTIRDNFQNEGDDIIVKKFVSFWHKVDHTTKILIKNIMAALFKTYSNPLFQPQSKHLIDLLITVLFQMVLITKKHNLSLWRNDLDQKKSGNQTESNLEKKMSISIDSLSDQSSNSESLSSSILDSRTQSPFNNNPLNKHHKSNSPINIHDPSNPSIFKTPNPSVKREADTKPEIQIQKYKNHNRKATETFQKMSSPFVISESILQILRDPKCEQTGIELIYKYIEIIKKLGSEIVFSDFINNFMNQAVHYCYLPAIQCKSVGCQIISIFCSTLDPFVIVENYLNIVNGLLSVIENSPKDSSFVLYQKAKSTLIQVISKLLDIYSIEQQDNPLQRNPQNISNSDLFPGNEKFTKIPLDKMDNEEDYPSNEIEMEIEIWEESNNQDQINPFAKNMQTPIICENLLLLLFQEVFSPNEAIGKTCQEIIEKFYPQNETLFTNIISKFSSQFYSENKFLGDNFLYKVSASQTRILNAISFIMRISPQSLSDTSINFLLNLVHYTLLLFQNKVVYIYDDQDIQGQLFQFYNEKYNFQKEKLDPNKDWRKIPHPNYKSSRNQKSLMKATINFLSQIILSKILVSPTQQKIKNRIVYALFSLISHENKRIVQYCNFRLENIISEQLISLSNFEMILTIHYEFLQKNPENFFIFLSAVQKLSKLFSGILQPKFGSILIDYMKNFYHSKAKSKTIAWLITTIMNIFEFIPNQSFIQDLKDITLHFQEKIKGIMREQIQKSLENYANKYPYYFIDYFLDSVISGENEKEIALFVSIFTNQKSSKLREYLLENCEKFMERGFRRNVPSEHPNHIPHQPFSSYPARMKNLQKSFSILLSLYHFSPQKTLQKTELMDGIIQYWKVLRNRLKPQKSSQNYWNVFEHENLLHSLSKILVTYFKYKRNTKLLFLLSKYFQERRIADDRFLRDFFFVTLPTICTTEVKNEIIQHFLDKLENKPNISVSKVSLVLKAVYIPLLKSEKGENPNNTISQSVPFILEKLFALLKNRQTDPQVALQYNQKEDTNDLISQILQIIYLLFNAYPNLLGNDFRNAIFNFAIEQTQNRNITVRKNAYCVIVYHFDLYYRREDQGEITKTYQYLIRELRTFPGKAIMRIVSDFTMRISMEKSSAVDYSKQIPNWILILKWELSHDYDAVYSNSEIYKIILENQHFFYQYQTLFVLPLIRFFKILHDSENEIIRIIRTIIIWKKRAIKDQETEKQETQPTQKEDTQIPNTKNFQRNIFAKKHLNTQIFNRITEVLIYFSLTNKKLADGCLDLLRKCSRYWKDKQISVKHIFTVSNNFIVSNEMRSHVGSQILFMNTKRHPYSMIVENGDDFLKLLQDSLPVHQTDLLIYGSKLMKNLLMPILSSEIFPQSSSKLTEQQLTEIAEKMKYVAFYMGASFLSQIMRSDWREVSIFGVSIFFRTTYPFFPNLLDQHLKNIFSIFEYCVKMHAGDSSRTQIYNENQRKNILNNIRDSFFMLSFRLHDYPQIRKKFFLLINKLLTRSAEVELLRDIVGVIQTWMIRGETNENINPETNHDFEDPFITLEISKNQKQTGWEKCHKYIQLVLSPEEKIMFMHSFVVLYSNVFDISIRQLILDILLQVSKDEKLKSSREFFQQMFMYGLVSEDKATRKHFFNIIHGIMPKYPLRERVVHVITRKEWKPKIFPFWIRHILKLTIQCADMKSKLVYSFSSESIYFSSQTEQQQRERQKRSSRSILNLLTKLDQNLESIELRLLLEPLIDLLDKDPRFTQALWPNFFWQIWESILDSNEERQEIAKSLIDLMLEEPTHISPELSKSILEGFFLCQPKIFIPIEKLKLLSEYFKEWHIVTSLMEEHNPQFVNLYTTPRDIGDKQERDEMNTELSIMYHKLGEWDFLYGLWDSISANENTKEGIFFAKHGMWENAQISFAKSLEKRVFITKPAARQ